jgi:hypothetical protein
MAHDLSAAEKNGSRVWRLGFEKADDRPQAVFLRPLHGKPYGRVVWEAFGSAGSFSPVRQPARFRPPRLATGERKSQPAEKEHIHA